MALIDKESVKAAIFWILVMLAKDGASHKDMVCAALDVVEELPTVEEESVRRGEWIQDDDRNTRCSYCKQYIPTVHRYREGQDGELYEWDEEIEKTDYCPNCGARMTKEEMTE